MKIPDTMLARRVFGELSAYGCETCYTRRIVVDDSKRFFGARLSSWLYDESSE